MIVKIPPGRRDKKSDFKKLTDYITVGMDDDVRDLPGFGDLTTYVAGEKNEDGADKCIAVSLQHINSLDTAAAELYAVAAKNTRVVEPVLHIIVSWPEHERPSNEDIFWAGRRLLKAIRLDEHQAIMAIHGDTDNIHCHIEVSRVHPKTFKSQPLPWVRKTLHREARYIEIEKDWFHDNGLFVVRQTPDGQKFVVPNDGFAESEEIVHEPLDGGAAQIETWSDETSLLSFCRDVVATEALNALESEPTWEAVHRVMADNGMRLKKSGPNSWQLEAVNESAEIVRLPASKALRKLRLNELPDKLGDFVPSTAPLRTPGRKTSPLEKSGSRAERPPRPTKRDPEKREQRRLERAAERTALIERFRAVRDEATKARAGLRDGRQDVATWRVAQLETLRTDFALKRTTIKNNTRLSDTAKRQQYSVLAMERMQARLAIDAEAARRRQSLTAGLPPLPTWRKWIEDLARSGDEAAVKALRGMVYQERRETKKESANDAGEDDGSASEDGAPEEDIEEVMHRILHHERSEDAIRPASASIIRPYQADVLLKLIHGMRWSVTNNGNVRYQRAEGDPLFTDRGNKLTFDRRTVTDEELRVALLHARQKWGPSIVLTGSDATFTERMVKAAAEVGLQVKNPELRSLREKYEIQKAPAQRSSRQSAGANRQGADNARRALALSIAERDADAVIEAPGADDRYEGIVVSHNEYWVAQRVASGTYIFHERAAVQGREVEEGTPLVIEYAGAKAKATDAPTGPGKSPRESGGDQRKRRSRRGG